ncbi:MAG: Crp/Fnr family transcriptional regulator [Proteobacteria bacterium]|nr:Crp/Fnr family transcriptional regulator [Pseudomonadota bacterium]MBU1542429.1 Crp/Fnr family transcriptional regulator [Pseudomonadota bacterium]MBU2482805.1 Crp/Fnr family transcriptional regulator [Pseudomonadota bacterium]
MDKMNSTTTEIKENEFLKNLPQKQYDDIIQSGIQKILKPKSILFRQGEAANRCYLIKKGHLKLTKLSEQGKEVIIRYLSDGELTAAVAVLNNKEYPLTAESIETTEVIGWDKSTLIRMMKNMPDIAINALSVVLERLDNVQNRYMELCTQRVEQRVARTLLRLIKTSGLKTSGGICIDIPLSRQNIADYTGATVFTVSRILSSWEKLGWIKSEREKITIVDAHALVIFADKIE